MYLSLLIRILSLCCSEKHLCDDLSSLLLILHLDHVCKDCAFQWSPISLVFINTSSLWEFLIFLAFLFHHYWPHLHSHPTPFVWQKHKVSPQISRVDKHEVIMWSQVIESSISSRKDHDIRVPQVAFLLLLEQQSWKKATIDLQHFYGTFWWWLALFAYHVMFWKSWLLSGCA